MSTIRIAIVGDDKAEKESLKTHLSARSGISVVFDTDDGEAAMREIERDKTAIDVVITQVLMAGVSGLDLIEHFAGVEGAPKFIVLSDLKSEVFMCRCLAAGAVCYLLKPINYKQLETRIIDVCGQNQTAKRSGGQSSAGMVNNTKSIDERLATIFVSIGIPPHIKGYQFLRDGIKFVVEDPAIINTITRGLYPTIAKKYSTTASKVERAIRHAIEVAWSRGKIDNINNLFGVKVYTANDKPTNGEFIALSADKMLLEGA